MNATTVTLRLNFSYLQGEALGRFKGVLVSALGIHSLGPGGPRAGAFLARWGETYAATETWGEFIRVSES